MTKRMLVDATHPEETRVAIVDSYRDNNRLEDLDFDLASKPILRGNIYLAKVMRIEPSLQAAFVEYGGNRHGFLPFGEIHPDYFRIPVADRSAEDEEQELSAEQDDADQGVESQSEMSQDEMETPDGIAEESSVVQQEVLVETQPVPVEPTSKIDAFVQQRIGEEDATLGLITDFGNAAVDGGSLTEVAMPETPPESVGGDSTERIVRQHRPRYRIQEVLKRGQIMLVQVVKEERGNKGAALTTYLSLAGRYCVLMPNTDHGGGVSRKITNHQDRRRMKEILDQLEIPEGMAVILRTAGMEQAPPDIQRDLDYLVSMWDNIREQTLRSSAPSLIYEEASLIKRSVRDLYTPQISEILVAGQQGYEKARDFMRALMPDDVEKIKPYEDSTPLFIRYQVENQIDALHSPVVQLRSGGYLVINPTEALVSIDVNSGRATRERHIEETALKTNLEAAEEIARQLRLRDLAGLVVIDFIDMEDGRNNAAVERRLKEAMKNDRARLQIGRISPFGLLELSRQRLRPSLVEISFEKCPHCMGTGYVRSPDSAALSVLRAVEEDALRGRTSAITVFIPSAVAVYILNHKRDVLDRLEKRYQITVIMQADEQVPPPGYKIERAKNKILGSRALGPAVNADQVIADAAERETNGSYGAREMDESHDDTVDGGEPQDENGGSGRRGRFRQNDRLRRRNRRNRFGGRDRVGEDVETDAVEGPSAGVPNGGSEGAKIVPSEAAGSQASSEQNDGNADDPSRSHTRRRRRGRRGGGRRSPYDKPDAGDRENQAGTPRGEPVPETPYKAPFIPTSIHEIDTTPKPVQATRPADVSLSPLGGPVSQPKTSGRVAASYETVNPPTDQPKAGWWRRLTGQ